MIVNVKEIIDNNNNDNNKWVVIAGMVEEVEHPIPTKNPTR